MGAIAIAPDGTLYAGTGETNPGGGSITYGGDGIYRSTDGGRHLEARRARVLRHHRPHRRRPEEPRTDLGRRERQPLRPRRTARRLRLHRRRRLLEALAQARRTTTTGGVDIAIDPKDTDHVVAAMWDHLRKPDDRRYTGVGSGIWETHNGGRSWQRLGTGRGAARAVRRHRSHRRHLRAVGRRPASTRSTPTTPAARSRTSSPSTDNGGVVDPRPPAPTTSAARRAPTAGGSRGSSSIPDDANAPVRRRPQHVPVDERRRQLQRRSAELHADQHIAVWDTHAGGDVYIGNDGGLYASANGGSSWTHSADEPWSQYVSLDVSEQDPTRFLGGLQDNGTRASWTTPPFQDIIGGDGQRALISPTDKNTYYGCYQYGNCTGFSGGSQFGLPFDPTGSRSSCRWSSSPATRR